MKRTKIKNKSLFKVNTSTTGTPLREILHKAITMKEPIDTNVGKFEHTERKDGVKPEHDIRTDKYDIALEAVDKTVKAYRARSEGIAKQKEAEAKQKAEAAAKREAAIQKIMEG